MTDGRTDDVDAIFEGRAGRPRPALDLLAAVGAGPLPQLGGAAGRRQGPRARRPGARPLRRQGLRVAPPAPDGPRPPPRPARDPRAHRLPGAEPAHLRAPRGRAGRVLHEPRRAQRAGRVDRQARLPRALRPRRHVDGDATAAARSPSTAIAATATARSAPRTAAGARRACPRRARSSRFLCERYAMYGVHADCSLVRGDIQHSPWQLRDVDVDLTHGSVLAVAGVAGIGGRITWLTATSPRTSCRPCSAS